MKILLFILILAFSIPPLFSQFFEYGQEPASIKWKSADTENFRLIFPSGYEENVPKLLWLLEESYELNAAGLNEKPKKIDVVVHNQNVVSNGFVALAPRRMELFIHPDPQGYPGDRLRQLTIHEMRHVVQIGKLNKGFTRLMSVFTGEQANALAAGMLPFWLLEGDAILAETMFSETGRGRLPGFEKEIKAILIDNKKHYSYEKSYFGSYKDFIPDYYRYGFQMAAHAQFKYGDDFWKDGIEYTGRNSWLLSPLSLYIKRETGLNRSAFYNESMTYIRSYWEKSAEARKIQEYNHLNPQHRIYTSYSYPVILKDSGIIAIKSGLDITPSIVRIHPDGKEKKLLNPGFLQSGRIDVKGGKIIWDEHVPDPRWGNRSYSILCIFDIEKGLKEYLTKNTRYYSPAFSSSGDTVIAIEADSREQNHLVFLSPGNGHFFFKVPSPGNSVLQSPEWIDGTDEIAAIASDENGKRIVLFNRVSGTWDTIFNSGFHDIHDLASNADYLVFRGGFPGIDDIFAFDIKNRELFRLSYTRYGAYYPSFSSDGKEISFSEYTGNGYNTVRIPFNPAEKDLIRIEDLETNEQPFFQSGLHSKTNQNKINIPPDFIPTVKNYSRFKNLFRFHSWLPFYFDYSNPSLENPNINPGFSLASQNILSTAITSLAYEYREKTHFLHTSFTYKGFLPVMSFSSEYGGTPLVLRRNSDPEPLFNKGIGQNYGLLSYIPLNFNSGILISGLQAMFKLNYSGNYFYYQKENAYRRGMVYTEPRLYLYSYTRLAQRDIQPRAGMILDGRRLSTPFEDEQLGKISSLRGIAYLPGLLRNHGIKLQAQWQEQKPGKYLFNNQVLFIRGYESLPNIKLSKYSADYVLPLLYPDLRIGPLIYLKRVHANLFYDYMQAKDVYDIIDEARLMSDKILRSYGAEIYFEYHFMRILFPFIQGLRVSYLPEKQGYNLEGIFSIDIGRF